MPLLVVSTALIVSTLSILTKGEQGRKLRTKYANESGWFEIYVDDMVRAKSFYEAVFKVTLEKLDNETGIDIEMWVFPSDM